jgi:hypothetical protein
MLKVGINDNLVLSKVEALEKEGKLSVDFHFGDSATTTKDELNPFSVTVDAQGFAQTGVNSNVIKVWPPSPADAKKYDGSPRTQVEIGTDTLKAVLELKNLLQQFALCYVSSDKVDLSAYMRDTPCDAANWYTTLPNEAVLNTITKNMVADFNKAVSEHLGKNEPQYLLRVICVRQSAAKHYAAFRKSFVADHPVVENAQVPIAATKLHFTKFEMEKGLDKDTTITAVPDNLPDSGLTDTSVFETELQ